MNDGNPKGLGQEGTVVLKRKAGKTNNVPSQTFLGTMKRVYKTDVLYVILIP